MLPKGVARGQKNPSYSMLPGRMRKARKAGGLDLKQLSLLAELSPNTAFSIESGARVPTVATVAALAKVLGVASAWLAFGETRVRVHAAPAAKTLGDRLNARRAELGLSYRAVARAAGLSDMTVRATEQAHTSPTIDTAERIAKALGISPGWLAFGAEQAQAAQTISNPVALER